MLIPSKMNELMDKYFYDKTVTFYTIDKKIDDEGGRKNGTSREAGKTKCNVNPTSNKMLKENFGIDVDAKLMITCNPSESVEKGYTLSYGGIDYEVVEVLHQDSHLKILCL
ncbi:hypothetical protein G7059_07925 [Erysipelothrix sp. HDW6A]|uniref:phage head completion protein n=1 Tax=Erysipelothrix sp. HDW6A TaxID=2714928 RepID=UPI00140C50A4|nr:hypothetical protein [Erysipelothrix sp. HDW6A]QIK57771.1 hypothetical protein G7059_07925 [Erysipelothrix sp. HDW6A]